MPLLSVLWTIALLTIFAGAAFASSTLSYSIARNAADSAREEARAEAGLSFAVLALLDPRSPLRPGANGAAVRSFAFEGAEIRLEIRDELGRIDLNHASAQLLAGLFRAAGTGAQAADELADHVVDWRDADDLKALNGAEAQDYREAKRAYGPRNASFQTVDELKLVLGITPALFHKVEPDLTVHSGKPTIDPRLASPLARQAIGGDGGPAVQDAQPGFGEGGFSLNGHAFSVRIAVVTRRQTIRYEAVLRLTGDPATLFWLLHWKRRPQSMPQ